jgi:hypothetical protein
MAAGLLLAIASLATASITAPPIVSAAPLPGPITLQSIKFYSGKNFQFNGCNVRGPEQHVFPNTVKHIYSYLTFSDWEGQHTDRDQWYSPNRKLYEQSDPYVHTDNGPESDCGQLTVQGTSAAQLVGTWTYRLIVDGQVAASRSFTITRTSGPVSVASIQFFMGRNFNYQECTPAGASQKVFPNWTKRVNDLTTYSSWQGTHFARDRYYSPDGQFYDQTAGYSYTGRGPTTACGYLSIAGYKAARLVGTWTMQLVIDGRVRATVRFIIARGGARPVPVSFAITQFYTANAQRQHSNTFRVGQRVFVEIKFSVKNLRGAQSASISASFEAPAGGGWKSEQVNTYRIPVVNGVNSFENSFPINSAAFGRIRLVEGVTIGATFHQAQPVIIYLRR